MKLRIDSATHNSFGGLAWSDWTIGMCRGKELRKLNESHDFRNPFVAVGRLSSTG
jgi:hypothetical protein